MSEKLSSYELSKIEAQAVSVLSVAPADIDAIDKLALIRELQERSAAYDKLVAERDKLEAACAYYRQGLEMVGKTNHADQDSLTHHVERLLEQCDEGRLMLDRYRLRITEKEQAEAESDCVRQALAAAEGEAEEFKRQRDEYAAALTNAGNDYDRVKAERDKYHAVLEAMEFERLDHLLTRSIEFCRAVGKAAISRAEVIIAERDYEREEANRLRAEVSQALALADAVKTACAEVAGQHAESIRLAVASGNLHQSVEANTYESLSEKIAEEIRALDVKALLADEDKN